MSRQDKATTEKHTKILRELVKRPENKVCADCKHNDPRWASWNLGVFLCIRCSGIHRGMGTHISKVKSIDLDTWTPEQMESILKWGNRRANLYWEAHLKTGHIPPDHKMESFIRSKYESRRWAMDGPPPSDPSVLENETSADAASLKQPSVAPSPSAAAPRPSIDLISAALPASPATRPSGTARQHQPHQLLSTQHIRNQTTGAAIPTPSVTQPTPISAPPNDLFSLDFHAPSIVDPRVQNSEVPKKDVKQDILSLFSSSSQPTTPASTGAASFGSPWGQTTGGVSQGSTYAIPAAIGQQTGGNWGVGFGWNTTASPAAMPSHSNVWGAPTLSTQPAATSQQQSLTVGDIWGTQSTSSASFGLGGQVTSSPPTTNVVQGKDDVFGDIWGDFK